VLQRPGQRLLQIPAQRLLKRPGKTVTKTRKNCYQARPGKRPKTKTKSVTKNRTKSVMKTKTKSVTKTVTKTSSKTVKKTRKTVTKTGNNCYQARPGKRPKAKIKSVTKTRTKTKTQSATKTFVLLIIARPTILPKIDKDHFLGRKFLTYRRANPQVEGSLPSLARGTHVSVVGAQQLGQAVRPAGCRL